MENHLPKNNCVIVNFYAGPGAGKSTTAAGLFYELKMAGYNVELVREYAKDLTWDERWRSLAVQPYVTMKQFYRQMVPYDKVDVIITDSPFTLGLIYRGYGCPKSFDTFVMDLYNQFDNINYFLRRDNAIRPYNTAGRSQTEEEALGKDLEIQELLTSHNIPYTEKVVNGDETLVEIFDEVVRHIKEKSK